MNPTYKSVHSDIIIDKENKSISSNLLLDKKYSASRRYRKTNELLLKPVMMQYGHESIGFQPINLPSNSSTRGALKELDVSKKFNVGKVKKTLTFERSSLNGRPGELPLIHKDRYAAADKENRSLAFERVERNPHSESMKHNMPDLRKSSSIEPSRACYAEKEPMKLNPVLEPLVKEDKREQEEEDMPEKITSFEPVLEKVTFDPLNVKDQCNKIVKEYVPEIMDTLKSKDKESTPVYCLKKHKIPQNLRAKMVDWMVEVLGSYKCSDQTFFIAVNIMDLYFQKAQIAHEVSDLHLIGVTCMFMASKYEEIYPLRLSVVHEKIAHRKLNPEQIKRKEMEIFMTLEYKMTNTTPYEFIMNTLFQLNLKNTMSSKLYDYLQKVCIYLAKANMHDYELISQQDYSELAASTLFVAFKIIEQLDKTFPLHQMLAKLREILRVEEDIVYDCATRILSVAKNFDKLYPNLENLKKFHSFNFDDISTNSHPVKTKGGSSH